MFTEMPVRSRQLDDLLESLWTLQDLHRELTREIERLIETLDSGS